LESLSREKAVEDSCTNRRHIPVGHGKIKLINFKKKRNNQSFASEELELTCNYSDHHSENEMVEMKEKVDQLALALQIQKVIFEMTK
jgi:hypothetical protein